MSWIGTFLARFGALLVASLTFGASSVDAQELLANRSFESPVTPVDGNNFYATIPSWTLINLVPAGTQPFNVVRPWSGYTGNPLAAPAGGGTQYLDVNAASGDLRQSVTISSNGMLDFSGWFSVRDNQQTLTGLTINIRNASGTIIATASTSFLATDPIGLWKQVSSGNVPVSPGTYIFEANIPNPANFDLASLVFKPGLSVIKTSTPYSDPFNNVVNPKLVPGGVAEYTIAVASPATYSVTSNSISVVDTTPANAELIVGNIGGAGSGPIAFTPGTTGLTYTFTSLASASDDIDFSNNNGATWTYMPVPNGNGTDPNVTSIRVHPQGTMAPSSTLSINVRYRIK